jgi:hypothetical protein
MMLSDLMAVVQRIRTPPATSPRLKAKQPMTIPSLRDIRNQQQANKVNAQCRECARLLSNHLFIWRKSLPEKSTGKSWSTESLSFQGMDIDVFSTFIMERFTLTTEDRREWLLDRAVADLIWRSCTAADSPLPVASWQTEMDRKRKAVR